MFDMEHTGWSVETIKMLIATSRAASLAPVRARAGHRVPLHRPRARRGRSGVMCRWSNQPSRPAEWSPARSTRRKAAAARRSASLTTTTPAATWSRRSRSANRESLLIAQIETAAGVENVDAIAAVEGIDVLWIGHFDLSLSLGTPGQFAHTKMEEATARVLAACKKHGKTAGIMPTDVAGGKAVLDQGFRIVAYSGDLWIYQAALRRSLAELREHAP